MNYTNKFNYPQPIVDAIINDGYSKGDADISITGLIDPPRIRVLRKKHEKELVTDVSERVASLLGQIVHGILERANKEALAERRFYLELEGLTISGQLDAIYAHGVIQDYKLVSYHEVARGVKPSFEQQLNCYAYLFKYGYFKIDDVTHKSYINSNITKLEDWFILRDWSKGLAMRDPLVPQQQIIRMDVPLWPEEKTLAFLKERIAVHKAANKKLPLCSPEDRWSVPDKWAVMPKKISKVKPRSLKNHESKEQAEIHAANVGGRVEIRKGVNNRCEGNYCGVAQFCSQFKRLKETK